ncbi:MAG: right-handed parallel beta-helix repeat-containing protein [Clostridia bacterium]|nr:right-handed parallel beta-helix repeat-containing protein [Clostridia bacterium]
MKKNKRKVIFSAFAVLALSVATACAAIPFTACGGGGAEKIIGKTYWVSPDGTSGGAGTKEDPMDVTTALSVSREHRLEAGDTVLLKPGVYSGLTQSIHMGASGAFNGYITVRPATVSDGLTKEEVGDGRATLDFSEMIFLNTNRGIQIECDYVHWYGVDVCGAGDNGLYIAGSYNIVENSEFYNNRDTGLQLGRGASVQATIDLWPSFNLVKNCTSHNNYDNETYGENADGFAAKLTVGYGNVFDGCIAYRNSDDGWDLYAKSESGNIGQVIIYNSVAYENGFLEYDQRTCNKMYPSWNGLYSEGNITKDGNEVVENIEKYGKNSFNTRDGDGNGFKLGGSVMEGDVFVYNCLSFANKMHGVTDNSNPGFIKVENVTSFDNGAKVDDNPDSQTFGQIIDSKNEDECNNIDLARQLYSYNSVRNTLSLSDSFGKGSGNDEYRGSVSDSMLYNKSNANKVLGSIDANTKRLSEEDGTPILGAVNTSSEASLNAADVFKTLPYVRGENGIVYNISGLKDMGAGYTGGVAGNENRAHLKYRNADGSINMGDILAVKDYNLLLGNGNKIGSELNRGRWEDYTHFVDESLYNQVNNAASAVLIKAWETLTINVDEKAVYQDFDAPALLGKSTVTWSSSNEKLLKIRKGTVESFSESQYTTMEVTRPADKDEEVTLTATISYHNRTTKKDFRLTIKKDVPSVGNLSVHVGSTGEDLKNGASIIVDAYRQIEEPTLSVQNGAYYSGKLLTENQYNVKTTYEYATSTNATFSEVGSFTPNKAGVYRITHRVNIAGSRVSRSMSYRIFVASTSAQVDFAAGQDLLTVYRDGYKISGPLSNVTGSLYAVAVPNAEAANVTAENIKTYQGVQNYDFRATSVSFNFNNPNTDGYTVCYALANVNGDVTSQVYQKEVKVVEIDTNEKFMALAGGQKITGEDENISQTIYLLTKDLDFTGVEFKREKNSFTGLFNGNGHKISNVTYVKDEENVSVFYKLNGGTVENVIFENIKLDAGAKNKVGLVSECDGGYFHNMALNNVSVTTKGARAGGLIGQINVGTPTYITQVSLNNPIPARSNVEPEYQIKGATERTGGLVGFSQASSGAASGEIKIYISDCYVSSVVTSGYELGGIYGTYDCGNNPNVDYMLEIDHCVFGGRLEATGTKTFMGGMLGYQKGAYSQMRIRGCLFVGEMWFSGAIISQGLKNASGMVGSSLTLDIESGMVWRVSGCYSLIEEYNSTFSVSNPVDLPVKSLSVYKDILEFNCAFPDATYPPEKTFKWTLVYEEEVSSSGRVNYVVKAPYLKLNNVGSQG